MGTVRLSRGDRTYRSRAVTVIVVAGCLWAAAASLWSGVASAQMPEKVYTRADYTDWLTKYANAKPDFKAGDVLTAKDIERMRPFVIPGYLDYYNFPNFKMRIVAPMIIRHLGSSRIARRSTSRRSGSNPTARWTTTAADSRSAMPSLRWATPPGDQGGLELEPEMDVVRASAI